MWRGLVTRNRSLRRSFSIQVMSVMCVCVCRRDDELSTGGHGEQVKPFTFMITSFLFHFQTDGPAASYTGC